MFEISDVIFEISVVAITFVLTKSHYYFTKYRKFKKFKAVFGSGVSLSKDIAFSLPLWSALKGENRGDRYNKSLHDSDGNIIHSENLYGPDQTYAKADILGVNNILVLVNKYIVDPVDFISDNEEISSEEKSVIYVGAPIANYHVREILDSNKSISWDIDLIDTVETKECPERFFFKKDEEEFHTDDKYGYAAIYKCKLHPKYISYLIFGQHESGTEAATRFFTNKFEEISSYEDNMVILLKAPKNKLKTGKIEVVYESKKIKKSIIFKIMDFIF